MAGCGATGCAGQGRWLVACVCSAQLVWLQVLCQTNGRSIAVGDRCLGRLQECVRLQGRAAPVTFSTAAVVQPVHSDERDVHGMCALQEQS